MKMKQFFKWLFIFLTFLASEVYIYFTFHLSLLDLHNLNRYNFQFPALLPNHGKLRHLKYLMPQSLYCTQHQIQFI